MARRHPQVVHLSELTPKAGPAQGGFGSTYYDLSRSTGGQKIGCTFYEVPPGKSAFPNHWHAANEEVIVIASGTGRLAIGAEVVDVGPGDYLCFPIGPEHSHRLTATGTEPLRYHCFSTSLWPEVCGYPDSGKLAALAGPRENPMARGWFRQGDSRPYFDGEPDAE